VTSATFARGRGPRSHTRVWTSPGPVEDGTVYRVEFEADDACPALLFSVSETSGEITLLRLTGSDRGARSAARSERTWRAGRRGDAAEDRFASERELTAVRYSLEKLEKAS
jgi:hypothetical protein